MKRFLSLLITFLLTASNPLFADQPLSEEQSQNQAIAAQLSPLCQDQYRLLHTNAMLREMYDKKMYRKSDNHVLSWGRNEELLEKCNNENFSDPASILDFLGQGYALHVDVLERLYGGLGHWPASGMKDDLHWLALNLSQEGYQAFTHFVSRLPKISTDDPYDWGDYDETNPISDEKLRQHPSPDVVVMESTFLKLELLSLLSGMDYYKRWSGEYADFIQTLNELPIASYENLIKAQDKMVDLENKMSANSSLVLEQEGKGLDASRSHD